MGRLASPAPSRLEAAHASELRTGKRLQLQVAAPHAPAAASPTAAMLLLRMLRQSPGSASAARVCKFSPYARGTPPRSMPCRQCPSGCPGHRGLAIVARLVLQFHLLLVRYPATRCPYFHCTCRVCSWYYCPSHFSSTCPCSCSSCSCSWCHRCRHRAASPIFPQWARSFPRLPTRGAEHRTWSSLVGVWSVLARDASTANVHLTAAALVPPSRCHSPPRTLQWMRGMRSTRPSVDSSWGQDA